MSGQNIEPPLQPFRTTQFSSLGTPAGSHGEVAQEGSARGAAARCTDRSPPRLGGNWFIPAPGQLSHAGHCCGEAQGYNMEQRDALQSQAGIQCRGYRERAQGSGDTKLQRRCLSAPLFQSD